VLAAKAALAEAVKSGDGVAIAAAGRALVAAEAKAKETTAGKAAGGELQRLHTSATLGPPRTWPAGPARGSPRASSWCRAGPRVCEAGPLVVAPFRNQHDGFIDAAAHLADPFLSLRFSFPFPA